VAHACSPGYLGGRYQEDYCSKPDWANSSCGGMAQVVELEPACQVSGSKFKLQFSQKKKNRS
jgi:hypothetical protein